MGRKSIYDRVSDSMAFLMQYDKKTLAKLLTYHLYRNSEMENVHHDYRIPDSAMKILNKDICNKVYEFLIMFSNGDIKSLYNMFQFEGVVSDWDDPICEYNLHNFKKNKRYKGV